MESVKGIAQRIPVSVIEMALQAIIDGTYSKEVARDLVASEFVGENRIKKGITTLNKLSVNNPLLPYIKEHWNEIKGASLYKGDKALIYSAIISAAYPFAYEVLSIMGKYLAVQDQITTKLIYERVSIKYGCNKNLTNSLYMILPMFIEAGLLSRPKTSVYERAKIEINNDISRLIYSKSFIINNPMFTEDMDFSDYPYMMFVY